jgi:diketogulonate reductase-like aldo/keto reductase
MTEGRSEQMPTRPIPASGEHVGVIGLGTYKSFDVRLDGRKREELLQVLDLFFAAGGTLIDSSPMYGRAEQVIGELLAARGAQDPVFLATKVWTRGKDEGIAQMRDSGIKMRARTIDLMQVHNLVDYETQIRTLREWKSEGIFRYVGVTHFGVSGFDALADIIKSAPVDFAQFPYSIEVRDAEEMLLPLCAQRGVATLINRPLEQGGLFRRVRRQTVPDWAGAFGAHTWSQFLLKYILGDAAVTCAIPATGNPEHMRDNLEAGMGRPPDAAERRRMAKLIDDL